MDYKKKIIACFVLIITLSSVPFVQTVQASDFGASNWAIYFKNVIVKAAAQTAFRVLSNRIVSKIQTGGPDGGVAFVQNWINFATQAQYQGESIFRAELSKSHLCDYFSNNIKAAFGVSPTDSINIAGQNVRIGSLQTYDIRTKCSLPGNFKISDYQKDFADNGGWQAFNRLLEPQNNYYGTLFASLDEVARQRGLSESSSVNKAISGSGFTGLEESCKTMGLGNVCAKFGNIKTPGSMLGQAASDATSRGTAAMLAAADGASIAIAALTQFALNKLFDLGGGGSSNYTSSNYTDDSSSVDLSITSEERTAESYKQEFCTAEDNISREAGFYIRDHFPQVFGPRDFENDDILDWVSQIDPFYSKPYGETFGSASFPLEHNECDPSMDDICGRSYCSWATEDYGSENTYPYSRCSQACLRAVKEAPSLAAPIFIPPSGGGGNGGGVPPPDDALIKHPNQSNVVAQAKAILVSLGLDVTSTDCKAFEITKLAAWMLRDSGAGLLSKDYGNNCDGYSFDIIAFPDGYIYDVLTGENRDPAWNPVGCGPTDGDGTCSDRYVPAFNPSTGMPAPVPGTSTLTPPNAPVPPTPTETPCEHPSQSGCLDQYY